MIPVHHAQLPVRVPTLHRPLTAADSVQPPPSSTPTVLHDAVAGPPSEEHDERCLAEPLQQTSQVDLCLAREDRGCAWDAVTRGCEQWPDSRHVLDPAGRLAIGDLETLLERPGVISALRQSGS